MKTKYYRCDGFRPIPVDQVEDIKEAAMIFADRLARQNYGRRGFCHNINANSWSPDYTSIQYQAFIGAPRENGCCGGNCWISVTLDD